jgi:hypothetical protein
VQGRDDAEKVKYFIKNAIEHWEVAYVLFIGNHHIVPRRVCHTNILSDVTINFTSELYYADIYDENGSFSSWDADGDGIYGEWYFGEKAEDNPIDLYPDMAVGRLPCKNSNEVQGVVNKIITYEQTAAASSWFKNIVAVGGDAFPEHEGNEGEIMTQNVLDVMTDFHPVKLWASAEYLGPFGLKIAGAINHGCGFLYMAGHGNTMVWAAEPQGSVGFFTIFHMPLLINNDKLPVCVTTGCHNNKIEKQSCWGWQLLKKPFGGSIATIGSTAIGYAGFEYGGGGIDWLELQFFTEYASGTEILGNMWQQAITSYLDHYPIDWDVPAGDNCAVDAKIVQEWIIIGDPSLKIGGYR